MASSASPRAAIRSPHSTSHDCQKSTTVRSPRPELGAPTFLGHNDSRPDFRSLVWAVALAALAQANGGTLTEVRLYACGQYTDEPLVCMGSHCAKLERLDCTGLGKLTDAALVALGSGCPHLKEILLSWVRLLTDVGVCALARGCPHLETLSLHGIQGVTQASIDALAEYCVHSLVALDVRGCVQLGAARTNPKLLKERLPRLAHFHLI